MKRTRRGVTLCAAIGVTAAAATLALPGVTQALWRAELVDTGTIADAAVIFRVDGAEATSADPSLSVTLGPAEAQTLLDDRQLAVPLKVEALSQGNRGLRYDVALPEPSDSTIFGWADLAVFPVADAAACTVDAEAPTDAPTSSVPVPAVYTDTDVPVTEFWCIRADLDSLPDEGEFSTITTITGTHALGEISEAIAWQFGVLTAFDPAAEPDHDITFTYETFREDGAADAR